MNIASGNPDSSVLWKAFCKAAFVLVLAVGAASGPGCVRTASQEACFVPPLCSPPPVPIVPLPEIPPAPSVREKEISDAGNLPGIWPVTQHTRISSRFNQKRGRGRLHKGIDMEAPSGTSVLATASGEVTFSGRYGAYGNVIVVDHDNGYETAYAHLKQCFAKKGDKVQCGQVIGQVGITGNATAYHLHYEVRQNGVPIDPSPWLPQDIVEE
jgi:murein DD-endopeptidase MepM/ murein hydrolase activator NlpD